MPRTLASTPSIPQQYTTTQQQQQHASAVLGRMEERCYTHGVAWKLCNLDDSVCRQMFLGLHSNMELAIIKMASWACSFTFVILALREPMHGECYTIIISFRAAWATG